MRWNDFWFREESPLPLGVFRVLFSLCLLLEVETTRAKSAMAMPGGFHVPYHEIFPLLPPQVFHTVQDLQYPFIALLGLGLLPRLSCLALLVLQGTVFFADQLNFRNHPYFFLLVLLLLLVSPAGEALSVRALWRRLRHGRSLLRPPPRPVTAQRLIQVQLSLVYVYAVIAKLNPSFLGGDLMATNLGGWLEGLWSGFAGLGQPGPLWAAAAWVAVGVELFLAVGLWHPATRPTALAVGVAFHLGIAVSMNIWAFSAAVLGAFVLFLEPGTVAGALERSAGALGRLGARWKAAAANPSAADGG